MSDFITILPQATPLDRDGVRRLARHGCLDIHRVEWVRAYLAADGALLLSWFKARDAESVRLVLRHQGWPEAGVWAVEESHGERDAAIGDGRIIAEVDDETSDVEKTESKMGDAISALRTAGLDVTCTFISSNGTRLILAIAGGDGGAVRSCLENANLTPGRVWECLALEPNPPELFESPEPDTPRPARKADNTSPDRNVDFDAIIIGAGVSGICAVHRLVARGLRVRLYESANDVGGVWYWNRYPGARVDSETYTYGFSFSEELVDEWEWQELFSAQPEIQRYLQHVADRFDLRRHMRFDTRILAATYDDHRKCWSIATDAGERTTARYLIAATGTLSAPQMPDYPGMEDFRGMSFHTAHWPARGIDVTDKRVGVIGTGASGVQVIQTIAADVRHLTVFQRTPTYCVPQRNRSLSDEERERIRRNWKEILATCNESYGGFIHTFDSRSGLAVSAEDREAKFEELWDVPGFAFWFGNFADLMMNMEVNAHASEFVRRRIRERVADPDIARKLLPDHPFGTKRIPLENGYYEVYNRENVRLVDIRETPIERVTKRGIRTTDQEYPLDVIVWATGFDAGTGSLTQIDIRGEGGQELKRKWLNGPQTFLGLLVSGFPNLFVVNGPQNAAGLCNAGRCIEQNVDWIVKCIEHIRGLGLTCIVPSPAAEERWTEHVCDVADGTVLKHMKDSWFFGANTPGKARRVNIYAAGAREYRKQCEKVASAGYPGCSMF
ncbi:MAG: NAD(P)-binding domain-containing protein [Gammaproteobacteria bacterium]